jgi:predicted DNA-binding protein
VKVWYNRSEKGANMSVKASFFVDADVVEDIRALAKEAGKKQGQIIKEAIREYAETIEDYAIARRVDREIEAYERGDYDGQIATLEQMKARANARLKAETAA